MSEKADIDLRREGSCLRVGGRVDLFSSPRLLQALRQGSPVHTLDLADVRHMDSAGVATLIEALRMARADGHTCRLLRVPACVHAALRLAGVRELFSLEA